MKFALIGKGHNGDLTLALHEREDIDAIIELVNVPVGTAYIVDPEEIVLKDLHTGKITRPLMEFV